ncbi:MAG: hypothetical protein V1755_03185 [Chloroflexota bacterium]
MRRKKIDAQSLTAAREVLDRVHGKPVQPTHISNPDGGPVLVQGLTVQFVTSDKPS